MKQYLIHFKHDSESKQKMKLLRTCGKVSLYNYYLSGKNATKVQTWFSFHPSYDRTGLKWL